MGKAMAKATAKAMGIPTLIKHEEYLKMFPNELIALIGFEI